MANETQFGADEARNATPCEVCEAMCLDAVDGTLTAAEQAAFDKHVAGCVGCAQQMAEAQRGAAWMEMLKGHAPEPPADLLTRILAGTTGAVVRAESAAPAVYARLPTVAKAGWFAGVGRKLAASFSFGSSGEAYFHPRLAMTAAMAFFSLALTMNMTGVRVSDLKPSTLHRTVADLGANASRSFQSLRVVNQFESRVNEMRQDDTRDPAGPFGETEKKPATAAQPEQKQDDTTPKGTSEMIVPAAMQQVFGTQATGADAQPMQEGA